MKYNFFPFAGTLAASALLLSMTGLATPRVYNNNTVFDPEYYAAAYPDVAAAVGTDQFQLLYHYANHGAAEGRRGHENLSGVFDPEYYYAENPDVAAGVGYNISALYQHYTSHGFQEGRKGAADDSLSSPLPMMEQVVLPKPPSVAPEGAFRIRLYSNSSSNHNARLACDILNGYTLAPGQVFSYNAVLGRRTAERGFVSAPIFVNKEHDVGVGGGICKISTGIYNAARIYGLRIVERHTHSLNAGYVPKGMDATVSFGSLDLKFQNTTDHPITINARYDNRGYYFWIS